MNFWGIFWAQNDYLVVGYLMAAEIFEFWPNFGLWQLFKKCNRRGIFADIFQTIITWAWSGLFGHFLCSK